jgi:Tfp pilus assembly protein PilF
VYLVGRQDNERAERYFRRALAIDPAYALGWSAYGLFLGKQIPYVLGSHISLEEVRNALDKAEDMYKKSVELANETKNFSHASVYSNYAVFLKVSFVSYVS